MKAEHIYVSTNSSRNDIHAFGTLYRFSSIRANALKNNDMACLLYTSDAADE